MNAITTETIKRKIACWNCDWTGVEGQEDPIGEENIFERVAPGEKMPVGECPECHACVHYIDQMLDSTMRGLTELVDKKDYRAPTPYGEEVSVWYIRTVAERGADATTFAMLTIIAELRARLNAE